MEHRDELKQGLTPRPASWEDLPDITLYMDQLMSYMPRQLSHFDEGEKLTSAMVNNYIKAGLIPRADGKRYDRRHLTVLTQICALKRVLPLSEMDTLLKCLEADTQNQYNHFCAQLDSALCDVAQTVEEGTDLPQLALQLALESYASQLACRRILATLAPEPPHKKGK